MSEDKKIAKHIIALRVSTVILLVLLILILPIFKAQATNPNLIGLHVGGKINTFIPGYPWTFGTYSGYCPGHVLITITSPPFLVGEISIILPPLIPRAGSYVVPGVDFKGAYYPFPLQVFLCPYEAAINLYVGTEFGTGLAPR